MKEHNVNFGELDFLEYFHVETFVKKGIGFLGFDEGSTLGSKWKNIGRGQEENPDIWCCIEECPEVGSGRHMVNSVTVGKGEEGWEKRQVGH